jgi:hypothetical protein
VDYRGSKSVVYNNIAVKEQRVYGDLPVSLYSGIRSTLKGFERNYQMKIPSYQLFTKRQYSTNNLSKGLVSPSFTTGFTDGEGSFMVSIIKSSAYRQG